MLDYSTCCLEPVVAMGRTLATFTQLIQLEIDSWRRYRRALRREDQQALDALFAAARQPAPIPLLWVSSFVSTGWPPLPQALDFFAWDWFFALSMLLAAPVFRGSRLENAVRVLMFLTGALCILGFVWLPISPPQATVIGILGWGVAGPIVFLLLANLFTRIRPDLGPSPAA